MFWIALYSHTGQEIEELSVYLKRKPDLILTDSTHVIDSALRCTREDINRILLAIPTNPMNSVFVTLHGYMGILKVDVLKHLKYVYNGHPGLINMYPELKGKDPQHRAWLLRDYYEYIGSVIHIVTPEVDGGKILYLESTPFDKNVINSEESLNTSLRILSQLAWKEFFNDITRCGLSKLS